MDGHTPEKTVSELKQLRAENRLRREQIEKERIDSSEKKRKLREWWHSDWVSPYLDIVTQGQQNISPFGMTGQWQRRHGGMFPIYRSEQELSLLRFPSRWLAATNPYAMGMIGGIKGYVIGSGLTYRAVAKEKAEAESLEPMLKVIQKIIDDFLDDNDWFGGEQPGFEEEFFDRSIEDGETFALSFLGEQGKTKVRFIDPEQVTQPLGGSFDDWSFGIKTDADDIENHLAYNVAWDEGKSDCDEYDADEMTHYRRNCKRGSKRGVPEFTFDSYDSLDLAAKLRGNMGEGAAQQASIAQVMSFKSGTQSEISAVASGANDYYRFDPYSGQQIGVRKTKRGVTEYIPDAQQYVTGPASSNATQHSLILQMLVRSALARWNAPEWLGTSDASNNNMASGQNAERTFINRVLREQRRFCAVMKSIVWRAVEKFVAANPDAAMPWETLVEQVDLSVEAPQPVPIDALQEAQIAAIEIPLGVQSRQAYAQEKGRDYKQIESDNQAWMAENGGMPTDEQIGGMMKDDDNKDDDEKDDETK